MNEVLENDEKELSQNFNFWSLMKFVFPSIFTFVFIAVYQMVDGFFIQKFVGEIAISVVNLYYPIISLFIALGIMIGTGGNALIVKKVGEGKKEEASKTISMTIIFSIIVGIILTLICLLFSDSIMKACGATEGNIEYLRPYYTWLSIFSIAIILQSELGIFIIGEGKTVVAAIVIMIGGLLNCVLDYVFMKVFDMGIAGAAIATIIGYASTIVYAIWFYLIKKRSKYKIGWHKINFKEIGIICFNGSSDMISNLAQGVTALFMNHLAFKFYSEVGVSSLSIILYFQFLIMAVFMGLTSAVEPVFSYHYGSGNIEMRKKVFKLSMIWIAILSVITGVLMLLFNKQIIGLFFSEGTEIFDITKYGLLISVLSCISVGFNIFISGLFTAFSNGKVSAFLSILRTFVILTACIFLLSWLWEGTGLWLSWPVAEALSLIVCLIVLIKYKGKYQY